LGSPKTWIVWDEPESGLAEQPATTSATAANRTDSRKPDRPAPRRGDREQGTTAARQ
jgi:hypothetical protein